MKGKLLVFLQLVDGYDIRTLNLGHLRSQIGLVTQEPILFDTSIRKNIAYGAVMMHHDDVPFDQIKSAAEIANIHEFIMGLPDVSTGSTLKIFLSCVCGVLGFLFYCLLAEVRYDCWTTWRATFRGSETEGRYRPRFNS